MDVQAALEHLADRYVEAARAELGERLRAAALFGSVARGEATPRSDVDLLLVAEGLPAGRIARGRALEPIDERIELDLSALRRQGLFTAVSPLWKTPAEAERNRLLYLDMTEDAKLILDLDGLLERTLSRLRARLSELGARRERIGAARVWHLKPDLRPGERIDL